MLTFAEVGKKGLGGINKRKAKIEKEHGEIYNNVSVI